MNKELRKNEELMNTELKRALRQLNECIAKIDLDVLKVLGEATNLKLHKVCHEFYDMNYFENIFNDFCISEYEHFEEILKANNLVKTHIGRTSSFYIEHEHFELFDQYDQSTFEGKTPLEKLELVIKNEVAHWYDINDFNIFALSITSVNTDFIDFEDIDFLRMEIEGTLDIIQEIDRIYKYIEEYKESQCDHFMSYMDTLN